MEGYNFHMNFSSLWWSFLRPCCYIDWFNFVVEVNYLQSEKSKRSKNSYQKKLHTKLNNLSMCLLIVTSVLCYYFSYLLVKEMIVIHFNCLCIKVRVDFLSANGKFTSTSSHPCMLRFKSQPILFLETFLKTASLVAGYSSESQIVNMKMRGLTEENEPTACLRVVLEQRAEYRPGAGIPEIYAASLVLESELPLFKRIIWCWKNTIFIWTSMMSFMMELMLILVCCKPIIIPRLKLRDGSITNGDSPKTLLPSLKATDDYDMGRKELLCCTRRCLTYSVIFGSPN